MAASDQRVALNDAATRLQGVRAAAVAAQTELKQQQALLTQMEAQYAPYVQAAEGGPFAAEWAALMPEFAQVKAVVDAALKETTVQTLTKLAPGV